MALRSCLDERPGPVVADTSVVINLNATGDGEAILGALPNRCVIVEEVSRELEAGRRTGRGDADALGALIEQQLVEHAQLGTWAYRTSRISSAGRQPTLSMTVKPRRSLAP